jgi:hypothetical protein
MRQPGFSPPPRGSRSTREQIAARGDRAAGGRAEVDAAGQRAHMTGGARCARHLDPVRVRTFADAAHHRGRARVRRAPGGGGRAADGRGVPWAATARGRGSSRPLGSGGGWIPWGDLDLGLGPENATPTRAREELIIFPRRWRGRAAARVRRRVREQGRALAGNHFATIVEGNEQLRELEAGACSGRARRRSSSASADARTKAFKRGRCGCVHRDSS